MNGERLYSKEVSFNLLGYSIFHASVKVTQTEYHTTATHPELLEDRCSAWFNLYAPIRDGFYQGPSTFKSSLLCSYLVLWMLHTAMANKQRHSGYDYFAFLNNETQQILGWFWCHQWTLSQELHTGLQRDVVGVKWAELFYYADIVPIFPRKRCCHIPYNNMECGKNTHHGRWHILTYVM